MVFAFVMLVVAPFLGYGFDPNVEGNLPISIEEEKFQERLRKRLDETRIPELELKNSTLEESIEFLRLRSVELSPEKEPTMRGFGFVVRGPRLIEDALGDGDLGGGEDFNVKTITLSARDVGIAEALDLICEAAGMRWWVDEEVLKIVIGHQLKLGASICEKLDAILILKYRVNNMGAFEALDSLLARAKRSDLFAQEESLGYSWQILVPMSSTWDDSEYESPYGKKITVSSNNVSVAEALDLVCEEAGLVLEFGKSGMLVKPD